MVVSISVVYFWNSMADWELYLTPKHCPVSERVLYHILLTQEKIKFKIQSMVYTKCVPLFYHH